MFGSPVLMSLVNICSIKMEVWRNVMSTWKPKDSHLSCHFIPKISKYRTVYWSILYFYRYPVPSSLFLHYSDVGRDNSVGIATRYVLGGRKIESRWMRDFPHQSKKALGPAHSPTKRIPVSLSVVKQPGRGLDLLPTSNTEIKERVLLYTRWPVRYMSTPVLGLHDLLSDKIYLFTLGIETSLQRPRLPLGPQNP